MIAILAMVCGFPAVSLASPPVEICQEVTVTTSDFADITMQSCMIGAPQLAEWMKQRPGHRLAGWRCVIGARRSNT